MAVFAGNSRLPELLAALKAPADLYIINRENINWLVSNTKFNL